MPVSGLSVEPVADLPEVGDGERLGALIAEAADLSDGDVVVVSQKVVSKAEGRVRCLDDVEPGERARALATELDKDPALVELALAESRSVLRAEGGVLITETTGGWVCANAGIDSSNVPGERKVTLLPLDCDVSARRIREEIRQTSGSSPAVIVSDSFGRPWRLGQSDIAIGCAGINPLEDRRGGLDREGRELRDTVIATADQLAAAADLVRDKASGVPVTIVRGLEHLVIGGDGPGAAAMRRPAADDLFR